MKNKFSRNNIPPATKERIARINTVSSSRGGFHLAGSLEVSRVGIDELVRRHVLHGPRGRHGRIGAPRAKDLRFQRRQQRGSCRDPAVYIRLGFRGRRKKMEIEGWADNGFGPGLRGLQWTGLLLGRPTGDYNGCSIFEDSPRRDNQKLSYWKTLYKKNIF